jgi:hypothetical protein
MADHAIRGRRPDPPGHESGRMKPFRFGVNVGHASSRAEWAEKARKLEDLQARWERWGISYYVIFEPYIDAFAPVVARLAGR